MPSHTSTNLISMLVTRAISNSSKNHAFLMCRIWKMGRNLFSSLDIRDNLKVAYLEKNSNNPNIYLVTGSCFMKLSSLSNCITVWGTGCVINLSWNLWACLSVSLALTSCVIESWAEICLWNCCCTWHLLLWLASQ